MSSRNINDLLPTARLKYLEWEKAMILANHKFKVTYTARTSLEQVALFLQGRTDLALVNTIRKYAAMDPIPENENKYKVTWTLNSTHILLIAWDFVILDKDGKCTWNEKVDVDADNIPDYKEAADMAVALGLKAGYYFKDSKGESQPDPSHIELAI